MTGLNKKILIIDPNHDERTVMASFLKDENYDVEIGEGLTDAVKKLSEGHFKCLLMDVELPEMKGYEAVAIIKKIDPHLKIILTSKENSKELETKVREQNIFFYFIKSFEKEELKLVIHNAFNLDNS